ncbi:hypothetical protein PG997_001575 [Apiospora hydei]|uniref:Uncharacterized protein n=1 Tax=Apiospora hydei TaxID=1337664 RepID=A0ABR1XE00_9PEZI
MSKYFNLKPQPADNDIIPSDVEDPLVPPAQQQSSAAAAAGRGMPRNVRTIHDYLTSGRSSSGSLPPRPAGQGVSWGERNCPNARFCWPFDWSSWTLDTGGDLPALVRRLCMWITLATRTALAVLALIFLFVGFEIGSFVVNIILDVLGFFFIAWCLARIGDAVGGEAGDGDFGGKWPYSPAFSFRLITELVSFLAHSGSRGRWHFDLFLLGSAIIHIIMIATVFVYKSRVGFLTSWYGMWILIFVVAWVAGWAPEGTSYV